MCEGVSVWFRYRNICGSVRSLHCSEASLGGERIYGFKSFTLEYRAKQSYGIILRRGDKLRAVIVCGVVLAPFTSAGSI